MEIMLNGEPRRLVETCTLLELLKTEGQADRRVAVELNGQIVRRAAHGDVLLKPGDRVEIVHALGGG